MTAGQRLDVASHASGQGVHSFERLNVEVDGPLWLGRSSGVGDTIRAAQRQVAVAVQVMDTTETHMVSTPLPPLVDDDRQLLWTVDRGSREPLERSRSSGAERREVRADQNFEHFDSHTSPNRVYALSMSSAEESVRRYLVYLNDRDSVIDPDAVAEAEENLANATDPIEKMRAHSALQKARTGDEAGIRLAFITNAKSWALAEDIPFHAFKELGVPVDVLEAAGLLESRGGRKRPGAVVKTRQRAPKVAIPEITTWILRQNKPFTTADIAAGAGGSPATIKKAIEELTRKRKIRNLGVDPDHQNRGRAPFIYTVITAAAAVTNPSEDAARKTSKVEVKKAPTKSKTGAKMTEGELVSV